MVYLEAPCNASWRVRQLRDVLLNHVDCIYSVPRVVQGVASPEGLSRQGSQFAGGLELFLQLRSRYNRVKLLEDCTAGTSGTSTQNLLFVSSDTGNDPQQLSEQRL